MDTQELKCELERLKQRRDDLVREIEVAREELDDVELEIENVKDELAAADEDANEDAEAA